MDYTLLTEEGELEDLKEICDIITGKLSYIVVSQPAPGTMLISHSNSCINKKGESSHLSCIDRNTHIEQINATYCEVEVDGNTGLGCIPGNNPERALYAAIIDSVMFNEHDILSDITPLLKKIRSNIRRKWTEQYKESFA